ncbi:glycosyltransferase family 2 protein [Terasakiella pusilla]|uniref:glycosyltransferase family 2 protein n=1 Tax=Terasakiella pusilla TaxID=64973 RepID=UPI003AA7EEC8
MSLSLSIIVPFYNEEENIKDVYKNIISILDTLENEAEVIFIDDGSSDATVKLARELEDLDDRVKCVELARNFGQTAAMMAGIDHASKEIIIAMDGDGQNDPQDIPRLLEKIEEGYDVVSGWRADRQDKAITRKLPSMLANKLISKVSNVHLHDYGCSLKAYRSSILKDVRLYGEMHRFIPIYASWQGAKVTEIPVNHHARTKGVSKYGLNRIFKVLLDLMVIVFLQKYLVKPIYLFGGVGLTFLTGAFLSGVSALYLKLFEDISFIQTPLLLLFTLLTVTGFTSILMGLLAEVISRTYYEAQDKTPYLVRTIKDKKTGR